MAQGACRQVHKYGLKVIALSCHSDFVAEGLLEPEWLYEAHNSGHMRRPELPKLAETKKSALKCKTRVEIAKMSKDKLA